MDYDKLKKKLTTGVNKYIIYFCSFRLCYRFCMGGLVSASVWSICLTQFLLLYLHEMHLACITYSFVPSRVIVFSTVASGSRAGEALHTGASAVARFYRDYGGPLSAVSRKERAILV